MKFPKFSYFETVHLVFEASIIFGLIISFLIVFREIRILFIIKDLNLIDLFLLAFFSLLFLTLIYGSYILPHRIKIAKHQITFAKSKIPLKAVFISDLHIGPYKGKKYLQRIIAKINSLNPDILFLGGDLISMRGKHSKNIDLLKKIKPALGSWAVLGNHEFELPFVSHKPDLEAAQEFKDQLKNAGINVLDNSVQHFRELFNLVGMDDLWAQSKKDISEFLNKVRNRLNFSYPTIFLVHNPDIMHYLEKANLDKKVDLVLSGHTHGGQIKLPFIGPLWTIPAITTYQEGFYTQKKSKLFVSSGVGESGPRARLFSRPEIVLFDIIL